MSDLTKIGGLWLKDGKKGKFMSGSIDGKNVLIFKNNRKQPGEKYPDYEVFISGEQQEQPKAPPRQAQRQPEPPEDLDIQEEGVPF